MSSRNIYKQIAIVCIVLLLCYMANVSNAGKPTAFAIATNPTEDTVLVNINCTGAYVYAVNYVYTSAHEDTFNSYKSVSLDGFKQLNDEVGILLCTYNSGVCTWQNVITLKNGAYFESKRIMEGCDSELSRSSYDHTYFETTDTIHFTVITETEFATDTSIIDEHGWLKHKSLDEVDTDIRLDTIHYIVTTNGNLIQQN